MKGFKRKKALRYIKFKRARQTDKMNLSAKKFIKKICLF